MIRKSSRGFSALAIVCTLLIVEGFSAFGFKTLSRSLDIWNPDDFLVREDELPYLSRRFDALLGWRKVFNTRFGERPVPEYFGQAQIAAFGDSFVYGDEVGDHETWAYQLARVMGKDVINLGMNAYGPDQALLMFRSQAPLTRTPIFLFSITVENINRIANAYRRFYALGSNLPFTKPRFELSEGRLNLIPNPTKGPEDFGCLMSLECLREIGKTDPWYRLREEHSYRLVAPYALNLFRPSLWRHAFQRRSLDKDLSPVPQMDLWQDPRMVALTAEILAAFDRESRALGAKPVVMIMPRKADLSSPSENGALQRLFGICRDRRLRCFNGVSAMAEHAAQIPNKDHLWAPEGHFSALGCRLFAQSLLDFLRAEGLMGRKTRKVSGE
jgi:hypothetical protein